MNEILAAYQENVNLIFDKYFQLYLTKYPNVQTLTNAKKFLLEYNDSYRSEINALAVASIRNNNYGNEVNKQIVKENDNSTYLLNDKVISCSQ